MSVWAVPCHMRLPSVDALGSGEVLVHRRSCARRSKAGHRVGCGSTPRDWIAASPARGRSAQLCRSRLRSDQLAEAEVSNCVVGNNRLEDRDVQFK